MFFLSYFIFLNCCKYLPSFIRLFFSSLITYTFFHMVFSPLSCCLVIKSLSLSSFLMLLTDSWVFFFPEKINPGSVLVRAGFLKVLNYPRNYGISLVWLGAYPHLSGYVPLKKHLITKRDTTGKNMQSGMKTGGTRMKRRGKYSLSFFDLGINISLSF